MPMLILKDINAYYGQVQVLRGVSLEVAAAQITCLTGRNGAGKTTLISSIMGLVRRTGGIWLEEHDLTDIAPHEIPKAGVALVPQGRRLFAELSVRENLEIGLMARSKTPAVLDPILEMFPRLRERMRQRAGTLSGGEQQMLAIARALCLEPGVLLLDEPTEGLQPSMVRLIREVCERLRDQGIAILLVEQRLAAIRELADSVVILEDGKIQAVADRAALQADPDLLERYLALSADRRT